MNILATQYTLQTKSLDIYLAGCNGQPKCQGCHNPESWDFNQGEIYNQEYYENKLRDKIKTFSSVINNIMIFGGEPLDQKHSELLTLLYDLNETNLPIWLFTRYELDEIPEEIIGVCNYIKCGRFLPELKTDDNIQYGIKLPTSNQYIYKKGVDY